MFCNGTGLVETYFAEKMEQLDYNYTDTDSTIAALLEFVIPVTTSEGQWGHRLQTGAGDESNYSDTCPICDGEGTLTDDAYDAWEKLCVRSAVEQKKLHDMEVVAEKTGLEVTMPPYLMQEMNKCIEQMRAKGLLRD